MCWELRETGFTGIYDNSGVLAVFTLLVVVAVFERFTRTMEEWRLV